MEELPKKGTQLLEENETEFQKYAIVIQKCNETKNNKELKVRVLKYNLPFLLLACFQIC